MADLRLFIISRPNLDDFVHFWINFGQFLTNFDIIGQKVFENWLGLPERHELFAGLRQIGNYLAGLSRQIGNYLEGLSHQIAFPFFIFFSKFLRVISNNNEEVFYSNKGPNMALLFVSDMLWEMGYILN